MTNYVLQECWLILIMNVSFLSQSIDKVLEWNRLTYFQTYCDRLNYASSKSYILADQLSSSCGLCLPRGIVCNRGIPTRQNVANSDYLTIYRSNPHI
jgi:hypothetical protein